MITKNPIWVIHRVQKDLGVKLSGPNCTNIVAVYVFQTFKYTFSCDREQKSAAPLNIQPL